jgi:tellurite resistance protein
MIERFIRLVRDRAAPAETQAEREAMIDLLVWTMFADRHVAAAEQQRIVSETKLMKWDAAAPADHYIDKSMLRARAVLAGDRPAEEYLDEIAARLGDEPMRRRALAACEALAEVDGEVAEPERTLLEAFAERLGLVA